MSGAPRPGGHDLAELKSYVEVHARAQRIAGYRELLDAVRSDDGDAPGSWVRTWCEAGDALAARGKHLAACRHYAMARFPCADGPAREDAQRRCVTAFDAWRAGRDIGRVELEVDGGRVVAWTSGLSTTERLPLLLVSGGIVTLKEQWAPVLLQARRLGMAGVVLEMPGVGENSTRYTADSARLLSHLLDALADRADVRRTFAMALSFSGHLALRCAARDERLRGIVTAGAPVEAFFTDRNWQRQVPRITMDTLARLTGLPAAELPERLPAWALTAEELKSVGVPVRYVVSERDEIIPAADPRTLAAHLSDVRFLHNDDVHGSPAHVPVTQAWSLLSLLEATGGHRVQRAALGALVRLLRARER